MWDYIDPNYDNSVDSEWYLGEPLYRRNDPAPDIEHEDLAVHAESPPRVLPQLHGEPIPHEQQHQELQEPRRSDREKKAPERLGVKTYNPEQSLQGEHDVTRPWWPGYPRD